MFLPTDPTEDKDETISQAGLSSAETFKKEHNMLFEREEVWKNISVNNKIREGGDSPLALRRLPYGHEKTPIWSWSIWSCPEKTAAHRSRLLAGTMAHGGSMLEQRKSVRKKER